jgi:hypothetical protein
MKNNTRTSDAWPHTHVAIEINTDVIHVDVKRNSAPQNGLLVPADGHSSPPLIPENNEPKVDQAFGENDGVIEYSSSEFRIERWEDPIV